MSKIEIDQLPQAETPVAKLLEHYNAEPEEVPSTTAVNQLEQTMALESKALDVNPQPEMPSGQHDILDEVRNVQPALSTLAAVAVPMVATNQVAQTGPRGGVDMNTALDSNKTADGQSDAPAAGEAANPTASADQSSRGSAD